MYAKRRRWALTEALEEGVSLAITKDYKVVLSVALVLTRSGKLVEYLARGVKQARKN